METSEHYKTLIPEECYSVINQEFDGLQSAGIIKAMRIISERHNAEKRDYGIIRVITRPETVITTPDVEALKLYMREHKRDTAAADILGSEVNQDQQINRVWVRLSLDRYSLKDHVTGETYGGHDFLEAFIDQDQGITVGFLRQKPGDPRTLALEQKRFEKIQWDPNNLTDSQPAALYLVNLYDSHKLSPEVVKR